MSKLQARSHTCVPEVANCPGGITWCKIVREESRGAKSEGLLHAVRYHNKMCVREKIELSSRLQRPKVNSIKISYLSLATKK